MFRSLFTLALSLFLLVEANAQTAPATASKTKVKSTKAVVRANRREVKKARRVAVQAAPATNSGWDLVDEPQTVVASAAATDETYGAPAATSRGELDNANVYAAPGKPVHVRTSNGMVPYSVRPARKPAGGQTTLSR